MYIKKLSLYLIVIFLCASCDYVSDVVSGGGQEGVEVAKDGAEITKDGALSLSEAVSQLLKDSKDPDETATSEPAGNLQGSAHVAAVNSIATQISARPKLLKIVDDWGNTCAMQNSEFCGGYGVALVPAHDERITGMACGPGTAVNQMVVNYEWVPC